MEKLKSLNKKELLELIKNEKIEGDFSKLSKDKLIELIVSFEEKEVKSDKSAQEEDIKVDTFEGKPEDIEDKPEDIEDKPEDTEDKPEDAEVKLNYNGIYQRGDYFIAKGQRFESAIDAAIFNSK